MREDASSYPESLGVLEGPQIFVDDFLVESTEGIERFLQEPVDEQVSPSLFCFCSRFLVEGVG